MSLDIAKLRQLFPALAPKNGADAPIFLDGPGGAQATEAMLAAMRDYWVSGNANLGAPYATSQYTTELMTSARLAVADLVHARSLEEIVFGPTATMLMFNFSRAISQRWQAGDEIIVTALDHYSNVSSWQRAAEDRGVKVHQVAVDPETWTLDMAQLESLINEKTKLIACAYASNTSGTIVDVETVVKLAKSVGAMSFIDAVHYVPHALPDVQAIDCDFMVLSAYKFTGPHVAALYGKAAHLSNLRPYKVEPATNVAPNCWEQGTQSFESLAGFIAAVDYLASLAGDLSGANSRRAALEAGYQLIAAHEQALSQFFLSEIAKRPAVKLFGRPTTEERTPTFAFRIGETAPRDFALFCSAHGVYVGDGNFYAQGFCEQFGLMADGGVLRAGCMHYNTQAELEKFFALLDQFLEQSGLSL